MHALRRVFSLALAAIVLLGAWTITTAAADRVTLVLRSGEKIAGDLDGQVNDRIYIRTSLHEQPKVPIDQIRLIDVGGDGNNLPASETNEARGDAHLLVPQNGAPAKGRFERIEGSLGNADNPKTPEVVFRTESGEERRLPIHQVKRLYLGRYEPKDSTSTSSSAPIGANERVISVSASQQWVDTGLVVRQGDKLTVTASGDITLSADPNDKARPNGSVTQRRAANAPMPDAAAGALIGRIGGNARAAAGRAFAIGDTTSPIDMPVTGRLFLGVNDDHVGDNSGQFEVRLKVDRLGS